MKSDTERSDDPLPPDGHIAAVARPSVAAKMSGDAYLCLVSEQGVVSVPTSIDTRNGKPVK